MTGPTPVDQPFRATASRSSTLVDRLLRGLDERRLARGSRILALGSEAPKIARALRARGHDVRVSGLEDGEADLGALAAASAGSFDGVVAIGFVERLRWDRWALQRIHRALKDGGLLLLVVPDLYSLRSLADPRYVATKLAKLLPRSGPGRSGPAAEGFRSYPAARLRATLERLGYETVRWSRLGIGPSRGLAARESWPPTHHLVLARRRPTAPEAPPDAGAVRRFEAENREFLALRERWRRDHALPDDPPRALEPERFAGASVLVLAPH
ncbi:MAG: methyltransferase domain-containing protein, partial [Actinomycetota bacterium]